MEKILEKKLIAVLPKYVPNQGNCTIIYSEEEEPRILEKTILTVMKNIGRHHMIDLDAMKYRNGKLVNASYPVPIYLNSDVFIPIKVRKPFGRNDKAYGYVNLEYIENAKQEENHTSIKLKNQIELKCLFRKATLNKHIHNGATIKRYYEDRNKPNILKDLKIAESDTVDYGNDKSAIILYLIADLLNTIK